MDAFPQTRHSLLLAARDGDEAVRERAFDTLVAVYWRPVYKYIRLRWSASHEDAGDLTQEFFAAAFEKDFFAPYVPEKSRFRTYLRTCVDGVVANARKAASRIKRGGQAQILVLDFAGAERELLNAGAAPVASPEEFFERESLRSLFALAVDDLRAECEASGKRTHFSVFERYDLDPPPGGRPTYAQLSAEMGISATQVTNFLAFTRARLRRHILSRLEKLSSNDREFRDEARRVFGAGPR